MQFKKGADRVVVIFPFLRIAVKFPIIRLWLAIRLLYRDIKSGKWERLSKDWSWPIEVRGGFKGLLLRGLAANWGEFLFYWQTRNPFVQPTYFSFFGLFNVQRADEPCRLKEDNLWCQLYELTNGQVFDDSHHFAEPRNFCFSNGKLRMLDYGSRKSRGVIARHGAMIVECFNPAYCWEEEKKKLKEKREQETN